MSAWALNGNEIVAPNSFEIENQRISLTKRLASHKLVAEVKRNLKVFELGYEVLSESEFQVFQTAFETNDFIELTYFSNGSWQTTDVWMQSNPSELLSQEPEYWGNLKFVFEEQ